MATHMSRSSDRYPTSIDLADTCTDASYLGIDDSCNGTKPRTDAEIIAAVASGRHYNALTLAQSKAVCKAYRDGYR